MDKLSRTGDIKKDIKQLRVKICKHTSTERTVEGNSGLSYDDNYRYSNFPHATEWNCLQT
jgi:hypothetical protein